MTLRSSVAVGKPKQMFSIHFFVCLPILSLAFFSRKLMTHVRDILEKYPQIGIENENGKRPRRIHSAITFSLEFFSHSVATVESRERMKDGQQSERETANNFEPNVC